ncbi:hypothetical protein IMY97_22755 [Pectobacterium versatile]|uniref:hypothetical protein n=1 Tax=Pectobacterium versatile TaxID=2488639 RepID=UPI001FA7D50E|nr:hypothetical protein [Pectobacterium versatile]UNE80211.1 hypothetical protein IMY97_22755 [Pectobacterium versatile]
MMENEITSGISASAVMVPAKTSRISSEGERNTASVDVADVTGVGVASGDEIISAGSDFFLIIGQ